MYPLVQLHISLCSRPFQCGRHVRDCLLYIRSCFIARFADDRSESRGKFVMCTIMLYVVWSALRRPVPNRRSSLWCVLPCTLFSCRLCSGPARDANDCVMSTTLQYVFLYLLQRSIPSWATSLWYVLHSKCKFLLPVFAVGSSRTGGRFVLCTVLICSCLLCSGQFLVKK